MSLAKEILDRMIENPAHKAGKVRPVFVPAPIETPPAKAEKKNDGSTPRVVIQVPPTRGKACKGCRPCRKYR